MPHSWVEAVNIGSIIKGLSLPCSPSSLHSANACICNVPEAALSPPATWIHCQPPVHGKALIWRQASWRAKVGSRKKWRPATSTHLSHLQPARQQLPSTPWLWEQMQDSLVDYPVLFLHVVPQFSSHCVMTGVYYCHSSYNTGPTQTWAEEKPDRCFFCLPGRMKQSQLWRATDG